MTAYRTIRLGRRGERPIAWFLIGVALFIPLASLAARNAEACGHSAAPPGYPLCCREKVATVNSAPGGCSRAAKPLPVPGACGRDCDGCVCCPPGLGHCVVPSNDTACADRSTGCAPPAVVPPQVPVPEVDPPPPQAVDS